MSRRYAKLELSLHQCGLPAGEPAGPVLSCAISRPPSLAGPMTVSNLTDFTQVSWIGWWDGNNYRLLSGAGNGQFTTADGEL